MPFRRGDEEPAHERLAREGGLDANPSEPSSEFNREAPLEPHERIPFLAAFREVGIHGIHRQRTWDAVATAEAPDLVGTQVDFVTLPDGTVLVEDDVPQGALTPLADALEHELSPPYRARAVRNEDAVWAVAANRLDVVDVPEEVGGDTASLTVQGDEQTLLVDDRPAWGRAPSLEAFGRARHRDFVLHAERLDGNLWAVEVNAL